MVRTREMAPSGGYARYMRVASTCKAGDPAGSSAERMSDKRGLVRHKTHGALVTFSAGRERRHTNHGALVTFSVGRLTYLSRA